MPQFVSETNGNVPRFTHPLGTYRQPIRSVFDVAARNDVTGVGFDRSADLEVRVIGNGAEPCRARACHQRIRVGQ